MTAWLAALLVALGWAAVGAVLLWFDARAERDEAESEAEAWGDVPFVAHSAVEHAAAAATRKSQSEAME